MGYFHCSEEQYTYERILLFHCSILVAVSLNQTFPLINVIFPFGSIELTLFSCFNI